MKKIKINWISIIIILVGIFLMSVQKAKDETKVRDKEEIVQEEIKEENIRLNTSKIEKDFVNDIKIIDTTDEDNKMEKINKKGKSAVVEQIIDKLELKWNDNDIKIKGVLAQNDEHIVFEMEPFWQGSTEIIVYDLKKESYYSYPGYYYSILSVEIVGDEIIVDDIIGEGWSQAIIRVIKKDKKLLIKGKSIEVTGKNSSENSAEKWVSPIFEDMNKKAFGIKEDVNMEQFPKDFSVKQDGKVELNIGIKSYSFDIPKEFKGNKDVYYHIVYVNDEDVYMDFYYEGTEYIKTYVIKNDKLELCQKTNIRIDLTN